MKNSIGSLAALAAFAAPALAVPEPEPGPPVSASFSSTDVSFFSTSNVDFNFNGDDTRDFFLFGNADSRALLFSDAPSNYYTAKLDFGQTFTFADITLSSIAEFSNSSQSGYYGFAFDIEGESHLGWAEFIVDTDNSLLRVQSGAWQSVAGASLVAGVIPEPASAAVLVGAGALMGAFSTRRRRRS